MSGIIAIAGWRLIIKLIAAQLAMPMSQSTAKPNYASNLAVENHNYTLEHIAQQVTVRILTQPGSGSGVVIARHGEKYTVLTNRHVVSNSQGNSYQVLTHDGQLHSAHLKSEVNFQEIDLALIEFSSKIPYPKAKLGNSNTLAVGNKVYAAGFPNYHLINKDNIENTRDWGRKAFRLTTGRVAWILRDSLAEGYSVGYTNEIELGMSGGPVLNEKGELIGINGRLKYPIQGIDAFTFVDGSNPSVENFQKMEALSWAIPISQYRQVFKK
jgi:serine protease Do